MPMTRHPRAVMAVMAAMAFGLCALLAAPVFAQAQGYMSNQELGTRLSRLAGSDARASVSVLGTSLNGTPIELVTLSGALDDADSRPALLITAGIDARELASTETAVRIGELILSQHAELLDSMTVYIVPRLNPDGATLNLSTLTMGHPGNARLIDDDRDRDIDEDGPDDLNGDGFITMMRRLAPPIEDAPTHLADPDDPRLNITPDPKAHQLATFTLYSEGIDNDNDGQINEDGLGFVDLNQNFMHMWPEHEPHSGRYPLSEPESLAIAKFVIEHDNIVMAYTLGRLDNLVSQPDSKSKDITGRAPKGIDSGDADMYKMAGELFTEATGMKEARKGDIAGSLGAWLYAQRGIPSFTANPWARPEPQKEEKSDGDSQQDNEKPAAAPEPDEPVLTPSPIGDISQETLDELADAYEAQTGEKVDPSMMSMVTPEMIEGFAAQAGIEVRRVKSAEPDAPALKDGAKGAKGKKKSSQSDDAKWLEYFETAGIDGFVDWIPYDHPTLGRVEIGGFKPLARINPPSDQLDDLAAKHTEFLLKLAESRARVEVIGPEVKDLGDGIYEVRVAIVNTGKMATSTKHSQAARTVRPIVVRLSADVDHIISGQRIDRVWGIDANGGRSEHHWIFRSDDLSAETIEIVDPRFGNRTIELSK